MTKPNNESKKQKMVQMAGKLEAITLHNCLEQFLLGAADLNPGAFTEWWDAASLLLAMGERQDPWG